MLKTFCRATVAVAALMSGAAQADAQELRVAAANLREYFDPGKDHSNVGSMQYYNTFDTLIEKNHNTVEPEYLPGLAVSWEMIAPTCMELKLRDDVLFQNGDPMTADDVVFSLNRLFHPKFPPYITRSKEYFENMDRAEKVDDYTVRIFTKRPDPILETLLNVQQAMIVPKAYLMGLTGHPEVDEISDFEAFGLAPVGTGPYAVAEMVPGEKVVWERFDDFWGEAPDFERIELVRVPELSARITALKNGEVDIITNVPPDQLAVIDSDPNTKTVGMLTPLFHVVFYNANHPKMTKPIRQALNLAIDRALLSEALWNGKAHVPNSHTYPQYGELHDPEFTIWDYDPDKARALLEEAGYDGFEIRYDTHPTYYTNGLLAAQAIQEMWAEVGVTMKLNVDERWTGSDEDMMARNWSNPMYFPDPAGSYGTMWSPTGARIVAGTWSPNEEYKEMWNRFRYSLDPAERLDAYKDIQEYAAEEAPFIVIYQPYESYGLRKDVTWEPLPGHIPYVLDFRHGNVSKD
ncbi:ABC transporter substrate-binding protein [uncultured Rhodospira sp.]|uniref:ABC transporter substrate-binding protein n=1 Tax=uncultured Rhodospira sp. TaxID=1936189 RepID=UPI002605EF8E|nr:ABC transporter substrate-binding protein [uncultured Rhodospira sp.]